MMGGAAFAITQEGDCIVALGYATYTDPNGYYYLGHLNIIKYSMDGTQIWNKIYDSIKENYSVNKLQILPNNDIIVMGNYAQPTQGDTAYSFFPTFMFKLNANGDSLWRRIYYYSNNYVDENFLVDNILNSDGSITACGSVTGDTLVPYQQIWIMKIDCNGYAPGCYPTGINEMHYKKLEEIRVYPNPATNQTTIVYPQLKEEGSIYIYSMLGPIVYEAKLAKGSSQTKLSIQHLKTVLYKVIVREKGMTIGEVSLVKA